MVLAAFTTHGGKQLPQMTAPVTFHATAREAGTKSAWGCWSIARLNDGADSAAQSLGVRALLNQLLAGHPECAHRSWTLSSQPGVAPELSDESGQGLAVSLGHSGPWLMAGVAEGVAIGVDVQAADTHRDVIALAQFMKWHVGASGDFYASWTLWEALAKCQGLGVLREHMPGFEALHGAQSESAMVHAGTWAAWRLSGQQALAASVVLRSQVPVRFELHEPCAPVAPHTLPAALLQ